LLQQLLPVYAALEPLVTAHATHPWLASVWGAELARTEALRADLGAQTDAPWLPATTAYVQRLQRLGDGSSDSVARLLAHVYVRHLGDLSGGQILQRVLGKTTALRDDPGLPAALAFHHFGTAADVERLKARMRDGLAALPAQGAAADAAEDEALWAFAQHLRLFDELAAARGLH
jgi:heme oxygenase